MKTAKAAVYVVWGFLGTTCLLFPSRVLAQAAPGAASPATIAAAGPARRNPGRARA